MGKRLTICLAGFLLLATSLTAQSDGLTIQVTEDLQPIVTVLYDAMGADTPVRFVEEQADLVVSAESVDDALEMVTFLPDTMLLQLADTPAARDFMAFVVSPDGQQVLIDEGLLPEVVIIIDQMGNTVELPQPLRRIISPYGLSTYMVYGVGAGGSLVAAGYLGARDPLGAAAMEAIDPRFPELSGYEMNQNNANAEEIAELAPDVILTSAQSEWIEPVSELGIPIVRFEGETPESLIEGVLLVGQMFGPNATYRAQLWVDYYDSILEAVTAETVGLDHKPRVLFTGTEPTRVASGAMYQSAMIEAAGGESVSAELGGYWNDVNLEQIIVWDPDIILVPPYGGATVEAITDNAEWQLLDAVQDGHVYRVPKLVAPWDTPIMDSVLGIIWMANLLHPELSFNCSQEVPYFYATFYDYAITEEDIAMLCD